MAGSLAPPLVEARGLHKRYGSTRAVSDMSFSVPRGEVLGFLGPNGAGKTTTMKMLTGFLKPTEGEAFIGGINVQDDPLLARSKLGYLPENAPLYNDMMVVDFLKFISTIRGIPSQQTKSRIENACERCGLTKVLGKDIGQLSKGYRQRVGLAQAMLHDPDLLILDEPTSGLDPNQIIEIRQLIRELGQDKTVIFSTHILSEVQATCSRVIIINAGKLVIDSSLETLAGHDSGATVKVVMRPSNGTPLEHTHVRSLLSGISGVRHVTPVEGEGDGTLGFALKTLNGHDPRESLFKTAIEHHWVLLTLHREHVSLEETFRRLTRNEESKHA